MFRNKKHVIKDAFVIVHPIDDYFSEKIEDIRALAKLYSDSGKPVYFLDYNTLEGEPCTLDVDVDNMIHIQYDRDNQHTLMAQVIELKERLMVDGIKSVDECGAFRCICVEVVRRNLSNKGLDYSYSKVFPERAAALADYKLEVKVLEDLCK